MWHKTVRVNRGKAVTDGASVMLFRNGFQSFATTSANSCSALHRHTSLNLIKYKNVTWGDTKNVHDAMSAALKTWCSQYKYDTLVTNSTAVSSNWNMCRTSHYRSDPACMVTERAVPWSACCNPAIDMTATCNGLRTKNTHTYFICGINVNLWIQILSKSLAARVTQSTASMLAMYCNGITFAR